MHTLEILYNKDLEKNLRDRVHRTWPGLILPYVISKLITAFVKLHNLDNLSFRHCDKTPRTLKKSDPKYGETKREGDYFGLRGQAQRLTNWYVSDTKLVTRHGWLQFLKMAFQKTTLDVGAKQMRALEEVERIVREEHGIEVQCATAPMMMDFFAEEFKEHPRTVRRSERQLQCQVNELMAVVAHYPGRVFPFLSVNPLRENALSLLDKHYTENPFAGVKIYPPLGYTIDQVIGSGILKYCQDNDIPVLMHCNKGGFKRDDIIVKQSDPALWKPVLKETYPKLRFCFGHFAGNDYFAGEPAGDDTTTRWAEDIITMMHDESMNERVFADISYHDEVVDDPRKYFERMDEILRADAPDAHGPHRQVMFGTDFWMLMAIAVDQDYWAILLDKYLKDKGTALKFFSRNALRYLGIDENDPANHRSNIRHYVERIRAMREADGLPGNARMAHWLTDSLRAGGQS